MQTTILLGRRAQAQAPRLHRWEQRLRLQLLQPGGSLLRWGSCFARLYSFFSKNIPLFLKPKNPNQKPFKLKTTPIRSEVSFQSPHVQCQ